MRNIKSCVNCLRRWQLCRLVGKIHREDDICSGPWRRRFTRRFLVNQEKKRTLYQRSCMHEDAEDMAHVQIWILPLTSWVKSLSCFEASTSLFGKDSYITSGLLTNWCRDSDIPCFWNPFENDEAGNGYGIGWMVVQLVPFRRGDSTLPVTTVKVWGWEDHSRRQTFQRWCREVNLFPFLNSSAWKLSVELSPQPDL